MLSITYVRNPVMIRGVKDEAVQITVAEARTPDEHGNFAKSARVEVNGKIADHGQIKAVRWVFPYAKRVSDQFKEDIRRLDELIEPSEIPEHERWEFVSTPCDWMSAEVSCYGPSTDVSLVFRKDGFEIRAVLDGIFPEGAGPEVVGLARLEALRKFRATLVSHAQRCE